MTFHTLLPTSVAVTFCVVSGGGLSHADAPNYLITAGYSGPQTTEMQVHDLPDHIVTNIGKGSQLAEAEFKYRSFDWFSSAMCLVETQPGIGSVECVERVSEVSHRLWELPQQVRNSSACLDLVILCSEQMAYQGEMKAIFSHDPQGLNVTLNLNRGREFYGGGETSMSYAIGIAPRQNGRSRYSMEVFGDQDTQYIMPSLWCSAGKDANLGIGVAAGIVSGSDKMQVHTQYTFEF